MMEPSEDFLGMLAHELRTPVSAIIGYHDLISEGILGEIDPRIAESLLRIRSSADQILSLVASLGEAATMDVDSLFVDPHDIDPRALIDQVLADMLIEASGRATNVRVDQVPETGVFRTDTERLQRALLLALHAAIKVSAGGDIQFRASVSGNTFRCVISGARLDPDRDDITAGVTAAGTSAAMRIAMAAQAIRPLGGTVSLEVVNAESILTIEVPGVPEGD
jgi:signal transduction histidine kinase